MSDGVKKNLLILALSLALILVSFWLFTEKTKEVPEIKPGPKPAPSTSVVINKPTEVVREPIAKGNLVKEGGSIVVKGNPKPIAIIVPPVNLTAGDTNVVVTPGENNNTENLELIVPPGGGTIELPEQNWKISIERESSPFRLNLFAIPEPSLGLGYDLVTINLDQPFGFKLNFGNLSAGPFIAKSLIDNDMYVGAELSKDLGRVNLNVGYGWIVNPGNNIGLDVTDGKIMAGISFNFN